MENIESLYCNYQQIVKLIGKQNIELAYKTVYQSFIEFKEELKLNEKIEIDTRLLMHAICDSFADIARLKDFHSIINENGIKTLSYRCSWLLRRKPIIVKDSSLEELVYINEKFIHSIITSYILDDNFNIDIKDSSIKPFISYCDTLLYYLKYRSCTPQVLEMIILSFQAGKLYGRIPQPESEDSTEK